MNVRPIARLLVKRPHAVLIIFTLITAIIGSQATNVYMVSDFAKFLPKDDTSVQLWNRIDKEFQMGYNIIIYIEADDIRDPDVLKEMDRVSCSPTLNQYESDKGNIDGVVSVRSLSSLIKEENAKPYQIGGLGGQGKREIPDDEKLIARYLARTTVQAYKGTYFTNTYKIGLIIIQLASDADYDEILEKTKDAIEHRGTFYSEMTITGTVAMQKAIQNISMEYFRLILPIIILMISAVLFFFHRSLRGIIITLMPIAYAIILTFGLLGAVSPEMTLLAIAVVALLLGLGVDYSIHIMNRFAEENSTGDEVDRMEKLLKSTGKAILLSSVTTIIGFGSLMISSMTPMIVFGFACAVGILFCFICSIVLAPTLMVILKYEKKSLFPSWSSLATFVIHNKRRIAVIACFFAVMSIILIPQVTTDVNYFDIAPEGIPELEKLQEYSKNFGGGNFNALLIVTDPQGLTYPETIDAIYNMEEEMRKEGVNVNSLADQVKKVSDVLERNDIIDRLNEFLGVDAIIYDMVAESGLVTEDFSTTIVLVNIPLGGSMEENEATVNKVNEIAEKTKIPHNGRVSQLTGTDAINVAINKKLTDQQTRSMIVALLLVLAALIVIFSSSIYGFLTMIPVGFVLMWEPGFLVGLNVPLSIFTISIASIMIGVGIDYGIHITHRVREGLDEGLSKREATKVAIEKTGLSLVEAAATTIAGTASILFIDISALQQFSLLIIVMVALSLVGAVFILPAFYDFKFVK
jgi:hydrophobe/amphiphile efflux-3 (HAE3) family protein